MGRPATSKASDPYPPGDAPVTEGPKPAYEFERHGEKFYFVWPASAISIRLDRLVEDRGEVHAEIKVNSTMHGEDGHVHLGRINLLSTQAREKLAAALTRRVKDVPWSIIVETVCSKVAIEYRREEPTIDLSQFEPPPETPLLVDRFLPEGELTLVFGRGGSCKSMLALALALIVQNGSYLPNGLVAKKAANVLYLDWEGQRLNQIRRIWALSRGFGWEKPPMFRYRTMHRPIWDAVEVLRAEIAKEKIGFVIIDSIGYACVPGDINESSTALRAMSAARALETTALVVAHVAKGSQDVKGNHTPFGSIFFENSARSQWEARQGESPDKGCINVGLFHTKVNDGPLEEPFGLEFQFYTEGRLLKRVDILAAEIAQDAELASNLKLPARLELLLKRGKKSVTELATETGMKPNHIRVALTRLKSVQKLDSISPDGSTYWGLRSN